MLEQTVMMETLCAGITPTLEKCGFTAERQPGVGAKESPVYARGASSVIDYKGNDIRIRFVYNDNRVHYLTAALDANLSDDSAFKIDTTYLMMLEEYDDRDVKSLINEINEYLTESYAAENKKTSKKAPATVSRSAAKSGALCYDPVTLATKIAGVYPELKSEISRNVDKYGEFLCEDFFVNHGTPLILKAIKDNDTQKLKRIFNVLCEVYEDGTNEVQSLICVTILGPVQDDPELIQRIMPYLSDTMLEPVLSVSERLKKSKSARLRLENPPEYKPKKQKKPGLMQQMMSGGLNS